MNRSNTIVKRLLAVLCLAMAFLVMASVFTPGDSQADPSSNDPHRTVTPGLRSDDPHAGLLRLGTIESDCYRVEIHATFDGPRYSIYDREDGTELGILLSDEEAESLFPQVEIRDLDAGSATRLMLVDDKASGLPD